MDKAKKIMRLVLFYCEGFYLEFKEPFISYDFNDKAIVIEWHLEKTSVIHINKKEVFYFILTDDSIENSLEGELKTDKDFHDFLTNTLDSKEALR